MTKKAKKEKQKQEQLQPKSVSVQTKRDKKAVVVAPENGQLEDGYEFEGKVHSISAMKGDGDAFGVRFTLKSKSGKHEAFRLEQADATRFGVLIGLLTAAAASHSKLCVLSSSEETVPRTAKEIEMRAKSGK